MSNYGCSAATLSNNLGIDMDTAIKLVTGYKETFKGVVHFGNYIKKKIYAGRKEWPNIFKRYYYSGNAHKLCNYLVQGSGADLLLLKLRETYNFIKEHPWWTYVITVHDEIGFTVKDIPKEQIDKEVKELQEIMKCELTAVTIIADVEVTKTDWGHKKDYSPELL